MCIRHYHFLQNFRHVLHIVRAECIVLVMITLLILSYVIRRIGQKNVHHSSQFLCKAKLVLLRQSSEALVVNRAQGGHPFADFPIPILSSLLTVKDVSGSIPFTIWFFFMSRAPAQVLVSSGKFADLFVLSVVCTFIELFFSDLDSVMASLSSTYPDAENSDD